MTPLLALPCLRKKEHGFSLVEITIALGLVTFGLVSTIAILPIGLSTLRDAREALAQANILQQIGSEFEAMPFAEIPETEIFYFDQECRMLKGATDASFYQVETAVKLPSYPGMPGQISERLKRVEVAILRLDNGPGSGSVRPAIRAALEVSDSGQ